MSQSPAGVKQKKPGPRPNLCKWCSDLNCSHCQCPGFEKCDHEPGKMCKREKYKRRLVCNPCEKNKLKFKKDSPSILGSLTKHIRRSISMDSGLNTMVYDARRPSPVPLAPIAEVERCEDANVRFQRVRSSVQLSSFCPADDETLEATATLLLMGGSMVLSSAPMSTAPASGAVSMNGRSVRTGSSDGVVFSGLKDSPTRSMCSSMSPLKLSKLDVFRGDRISNEGSILYLRDEPVDVRRDSHSLGDLAEMLKADRF